MCRLLGPKPYKLLGLRVYTGFRVYIGFRVCIGLRIYIGSGAYTHGPLRSICPRSSRKHILLNVI